ncbi:MAG: hypothetical protein U0M75_07930 [Lachnospiraceae bacterium]|jgi:hypothetical protein
MSKRVYISADYSENDGDRDVINELHTWGEDNKHKVDYVDTAQVVSGSISDDEDCRPCDLKKEFNAQINVSSAVIFVVGDKTASRTAGSSCKRNADGEGCDCTPYKQNANGARICKIYGKTSTPGPNEDVGIINSYSYLEHEFMQAKKKKRTIIVVYNSLNKQSNWLPSYMSEYKEAAHPFWKKNDAGKKVGDYQYIKKALGYE